MNPLIAGQSPEDPAVMHPDVARNWDLWSTLVGPSALARLEYLSARFPELTSAVLATADGLHIASIGTDRDTSDAIAAMNSSLFGVAKAEGEVLSGGSASGLSAVVSVTLGSHQMSLISFILNPYGQLLLSASAKDVQLATVIVQARATAYELIMALGVADGSHRDNSR